MRRLATHAVDELELLLRTLLEFRRGDGSYLPTYAEAIVVFLGAQPGGSARMGEVRERLHLPQSRTSRLCAKLARIGMVEITTSTEDRRSSAFRLTANGARLVDKILSVHRSRSR
jgi:DNA-binding MarR family transcriptional regulator